MADLTTAQATLVNNMCPTANGVTLGTRLRNLELGGGGGGGRVLSVDSTGAGDYTTITLALAAASTGDVMVLYDAAYAEDTLAVNTLNLTVISAYGDTVITTTANSKTIFTVTTGTLNLIDIGFSDAAFTSCVGVVVNGAGTANLINCTTSNFDGNFLSVTTGTANLRQCVINDSAATLVSVSGATNIYGGLYAGTVTGTAGTITAYAAQFSAKWTLATPTLNLYNCTQTDEYQSDGASTVNLYGGYAGTLDRDAGTVTVYGTVIGTREGTITEGWTIPAAQITSDILTGDKAAVVAEDNVDPGLMVVHVIAVAGGAAANEDITVNDKVRVLDAWAVHTGGAGEASDTIQLFNGANAISDAMDWSGADKVVVRAGTIDDAYHEVAAAGTLRATTVDDDTGGDVGAGKVYVLCMKVA